MDGTTRTLLARMPLAQALLSLWHWVTDETFLEELYQQHRGRSYQRVLTFSTLVHLIADALLEHGGSANQCFERADEVEALPSSIQAAYGKLRRIPVGLSQGFLASASDRLRAIYPKSIGTAVPHSVRGFETLIVDGKTVKHLAKRLKALRSLNAGVLGGKALVVLSYRSGLALAMRAHLDGHTNEVRFIPDLLPKVRQRVAGPRLWLADRAFSYPEQLAHFAESEDKFVIRQRGDISFHPDPGRSSPPARDATGRTIHQEWGWLGRPKSKHRYYVRRLTLPLSDQESLILVTNLLNADTFPAADLCQLYRCRWRIEHVFQLITEVFALNHLIGSSPSASIFQLGFCLLLYNMIVVLRAYLAQAVSREPQTISTEKLFVDVHRQMVAWAVLIGAVPTISDWEAQPGLPEALSAHLRHLLKSVWTRRWAKSPPKKRVLPKQIIHSKHTHVSAYRVLTAAASASKTKTQKRSKDV